MPERARGVIAKFVLDTAFPTVTTEKKECIKPYYGRVVLIGI